MFDPVTAAIGIGGSLLSGGLGLFGSSQQADAAKEAGELQAQVAREAAQLQQQRYEQTRSDLAPWRETGQQALSRLGNVGLSSRFDTDQYNPYSQYQQSQNSQFGISPEVAYQQQTQPFNFDPASDPGYQFRLQQGTDALEGSAAARGGLFSGQTGKDLTTYGQNLASQEYQNAFGRDLAQKQNIGRAYGQAFGQDLANRQFGSQEFYNALGADTARNQNAYNRLMGVTGIGQNAASQTAQAGQNAAQQQAAYLQQGAQAQGLAGQQGAGAWSNALGNIGNLGMGLAGTALNYNMFNRMYPQQQGVLV